MVRTGYMLMLVVCCTVILAETTLQAPLARQPKPINHIDTTTPPPPPLTQKSIDSLHPVHLLPIEDSVRIPVLDFEKAEIRDVLRGLGMQYNLNIYLEPEVKGLISLYLADISVKNAIDFIVKRNGYAYTVERGIVKVYKYTPPLQKPPEPVSRFILKGSKVDLDFQRVPLQRVLRFFSDSAGVNVIAAKGADRLITARLTGVSPQKALRVIAESNDYALVENDGVFYVTTPSWGDNEANTGGKRSLKRLSLTVQHSMVSLEVDNAALDQVIRSIAVQSKMNIVIYARLTGDITAKLADVPVDDALRFLLQNTKFTFWKDRDIYFIGSREMNQQKTTVIIPLRHIMAEEESVGKVLPPNIKNNAVVRYNAEHNAIVVIGSFDVVAEAQQFLEKIDKPVPQVLIEALVVDFNVNKIRDYGLSLFTQSARDSSGAWLSESFLPEVTLKPGKEKTERVLQSLLNSIGINRIVDLPSNFRASIHALESADIVKVHSTPQIATINGNSASITIGETRYYRLQKETKAPVDNNNAIIGTDERFEVIKFNTQLTVTPWVMDEGYVMVKIRPEFNIPRTGGDASTPPNVDTRVIESMVRLKNGQTIVLGGQRQTESVVNRTGVPILSSIPVLGWLFSSRTITKNETQMMIFLTPHVYYGDDNAVSPDDYFGKEVTKMLEKYDPDKKETKGRFRFRLFSRDTIKTDTTVSDSMAKKPNGKDTTAAQVEKPVSPKKKPVSETPGATAKQQKHPDATTGRKK